MGEVQKTRSAKRIVFVQSKKKKKKKTKTQKTEKRYDNTLQLCKRLLQ